MENYIEKEKGKTKIQMERDVRNIVDTELREKKGKHYEQPIIDEIRKIVKLERHTITLKKVGQQQLVDVRETEDELGRMQKVKTMGK